jgi:hypothetical protein
MLYEQFPFRYRLTIYALFINGKMRLPFIQSSKWKFEWRWAPVLRPKTSKTFFGPVKIFRFYLELYKNKFKNLIRTSTFKFSLVIYRCMYALNYIKMIWFDLIDFCFFNATFNNISSISWRPVLVVEEAGVPGEKSCYRL